MYGVNWKNRISRGVMIECLYAEGVRWAGWYRDENLVAHWDRVMGQHAVGALKRGTRRRWVVNATPKAKTKRQDKVVIDWSELDRWLAEG